MDASIIDQLRNEIAAMQAQLGTLTAQVEAMYDDIPEQTVLQPESLSVWSGRVMSHDGDIIAEYDLTEPDAVENTHIHYDGVSMAVSWGSGVNDGLLSWEVAEPGPAGGYVLNSKTCGDIVLPVPEEWEERQVVQTDEDGKLLFEDLSIKADDPATGFVFEKEDGGSELLQMKPSGGSDDQVLTRSGDDAVWADVPIDFDTDVEAGEGFSLELTPATESASAILTLGVPLYGKIQYVTSITPELYVSGNVLNLRLTIHREEYDMDAYEINELPDIYEVAALAGVSC